MDRRLTLALMILMGVAMLYFNIFKIKPVLAQTGNETQRGVFGDILNFFGLHGLVENLYVFKSNVESRGGLEADFLKMFTQYYSELSSVLASTSLGFIVKLLVLPAAIFTSICLPLYSQIGLSGVVLLIGLLTGFVYAFPIFLIIESYSKIGLVAIHGKRLTMILLVFLAFSAICFLVAYSYHSTIFLFASCILLIATLWFAWFLPILAYYKS